MCPSCSVEILSPPRGCETAYRALFTPEAVEFLAEMARTFRSNVEDILLTRKTTRLSLDKDGNLLPKFPDHSAVRSGTIFMHLLTVFCRLDADQ
jgi:hypothetical protein